MTKHLILEARWEDPVIQNNVQVDLEVLSTASQNWVSIGRWKMRLDARKWAALANDGSGFSHSPEDAKSDADAMNPKDLHKYTGTKQSIPERGVNAAPSYLNYQDRPEK